MGLNVAGLETDIKDAFEKLNDKSIPDLAAARTTLYNDLANAISKFVMTGTVTVTSLTATAPNGPVTGTGTGKIT